MIMISPKGIAFRTMGGTVGETRSHIEGSLIRLTWQPLNWSTPTTLQLWVDPTKAGATLSIHHEKLRDAMLGGDETALVERH